MSRPNKSVNDLAQELNIPTATLRRYLRLHEDFLQVDKSHKNHRVDEESIGILKQIREGYSQGLASEEVEDLLLTSGVKRKSLPADQLSDLPTDQPSDDRVNTNFIEALSSLEKLVIERFEQQEQILKALAEIAPALEHLDPKVLQADRVNARLNEWRIERKLENEAIIKWAELPRSERMMRTGMFKTEENVEKRERFVREYVDKHFDEEMRNAYGS